MQARRQHEISGRFYKLRSHVGRGLLGGGGGGTGQDVNKGSISIHMNKNVDDII